MLPLLAKLLAIKLSRQQLVPVEMPRKCRCETRENGMETPFFEEHGNLGFWITHAHIPI